MSIDNSATREKIRSEILGGLNPAQRVAAEHESGPLLIIAGAGAGKTRTLTHRIAHLIAGGIAPNKILAITFTNKAAAELRERLSQLGDKYQLGQSNASNTRNDYESASNHVTPSPMAATFHSLGVRILRAHGRYIGIKPGFAILDRDDQEKLIKQIFKKLGYGLNSEQWTPKKALNYISARRQGRTMPVDALEMVYSNYEEEKRSQSILDFDDLIYRTVELLNDHEPTRLFLRSQWSHIHVDEYQDTNRIQYEFVKLLCCEKNNLCVVGDTDQTIYTWRGAEIKNLLQFEKDFPNTKTVLLEENYRSSKTIIAVANDCINKNRNRIEKTLFTNNADGEQISILLGTDEKDEARQIASVINDLIKDGVNPGSIAILYRANFQSQAIEKAFISKGLPYNLLGTKFYQRKEVKDILAYLRYALNPDNVLDLERIVGVPKRGIGPKTLQAMMIGKTEQLAAGSRKKVEEFSSFLDKIKDKIQSQPPSEVMNYILDNSGWRESLQQEAARDRAVNNDNSESIERLENLAELINVASEFDTFEAPLGVEKLLEEAALMSEQDTLKNENGESKAVTMMTIHASKGLEFDHVFITGLEEGLFPSDRSDTARDSEEERRLFYVALTRARHKAWLSYATMRHKFGSLTFNLPSEFITEIDPIYLDNKSGLASIKSSGGRGLLDDIEF